MAALESAVPAQSVVKDVQTLKANLKEQEKRVRSENEPQEVNPDTNPQASVDEEQRKKAKLDIPTEQDEEPEIVLLDGPLPPIKNQVKSTPRPSAPPKKLASPKKDATTNSSSPTKVTDLTESSPKSVPVADAPATAQSETNNNEQPEAVSKSVEVESPKKPVATSIKESVTDDQKSTEEPKETEIAVTELKEPATTAESEPTNK